MTDPVSAAKLQTLKKRAEFLRVRGGTRWGGASFLLEARRCERVRSGQDSGSNVGNNASEPVGDAEPAMADGRASAGHDTDLATIPERPARFGFTVTKKLGNAVVRNRIKRRLREAVRAGNKQSAQDPGLNWAQPGCDYVIVARQGAMSQHFGQLVADLRKGFGKVHAGLAGRGSGTGRALRGRRRGKGSPRD